MMCILRVVHVLMSPRSPCPHIIRVCLRIAGPGGGVIGGDWHCKAMKMIWCTKNFRGMMAGPNAGIGEGGIGVPLQAP